MSTPVFTDDTIKQLEELRVFKAECTKCDQQWTYFDTLMSLDAMLKEIRSHIKQHIGRV